jgi:hypothetical protein
VNVVPRKNTPASVDGITDAVRSAWTSLAGSAPSAKLLRSLVALVLIETARGKSIQNHNVGNISASSSYVGSAWRPPWYDFEGGTAVTDRNLHLHQEMLAGRAPSAFRAYPTLTAGATDFVRLLRTSNYANVIEAGESGDAEEFRAALAKRYSKDYDKPGTTASFEQLFRELGDVGGGGMGFGVAVAIGAAAVAAGTWWYFTRGDARAPASPARRAA